MSPRPATLPVLWPSASSATKPDSRAPRSTASSPEREPPPQNLLATVLRVLRTRRLWVLPGLVLVPLVVAVLTLLQEERYTATAVLFIRDSARALLEDVSGTSFADPTREAATNDALVNLTTIPQLAAKKLGERPNVGRVAWRTVAQSVTVTSREESDLVEIELVETRLGPLSPEQRAGENGQSLEAQLDELRLAEALQVGKADLVQRATVPELELIQANALGLVANLAPTSRSGYYYHF